MLAKKRAGRMSAIFLVAIMSLSFIAQITVAQMEETETRYENLLINGDFESGNANGFFVSGEQNGVEEIAASSEQVHAGSYAAKFSGRTTASTIAQSYAGIELGKEYAYSAYVYSAIPMWINLQASVWAHYDFGSLWNTARGAGILLEAGKWTKVEAVYKLYVEDGKLYATCNNGEPVLAQDFASPAEVKPSSFRNLHHVDFEINALGDLDTMYVDDVELYDTTCPNGIKNLASNQGAEDGTTDGWRVYSSDGQSSVSISSGGEPVFAGAYSVKFNRTGTGSQTYQSVSNIELGKEYTYTVWAYSSAATWANLIATPWAVNDNGNPMWTDIGSEGFLLETNTWTKLYGTFKVYTDEENKLWISYKDGVQQALNHNDVNDSQIFASLTQVDFKFTASDHATTIYMDEFVVYDTANPNPDTEPDIPDFQIDISLTKLAESFVVSITGWNDTHQYQIWTYQKTESEIFGGEGQTNQWVLSHPYTLGSDRGENGFTVDGDAITRNIGPFNSVDRNYTVAVKVIDGAGNFVGQYKDTFTQAEAGEVVINKVTVDGQFADDKAFVKDIANDSPVAFVVTGNGVAGTVYTAKIDQTGDQLVASGAGLNEFSWDISLMQPGNYSVTLTASTADSSDSRTVNIKLYKNDPAVVYGEMTELVVTGAAENDNFKIDINPTVTGGKFRYRISEPWRGTIPGGDSELVEIPAAPLSNTAIPKTAYGVYEVQTFTYRDGVSSADDGAVRTVTNARPGEPVTLNVTVDGNPAGAEMITKAKGTAIVFTPEATGLPLPQYSFWRRDANGWVLIRDYSGEGLTWTPNRVGLYTIQVRAKATGGLTYEVLKNIEFNINEVGGDKIADVANITINQAALDTDAKTRTPILITANATSAEQDLLYKFIISNGYIYYVETAYSADPTYMWVPGKSGNYTINVLVKNQASFGKYDAIDSFVVDVKNP